jgi:hypothetical protein
MTIGWQAATTPINNRNVRIGLRIIAVCYLAPLRFHFAPTCPPHLGGLAARILRQAHLAHVPVPRLHDHAPGVRHPAGAPGIT